MSIFTSLLAIVATARLIPQDLEDRTIYTILAKPVPRFEYLLGKLAGVLLLLALSLIIMSALFFIVLSFREQIVLRETMRQMSAAPPEQVAEALRRCSNVGPQPEFVSGHRHHLREGVFARVAHSFRFDFRHDQHFHDSW